MNIHKKAFEFLLIDTELIIKTTVSTIAVVVLGMIAIRFVLFIVRRILNRSKLDPSLYRFIENIIKVLGWVAIGISVCGIVGINTNTFVAVLGAAGAAIALALKDSLANVAGGIIIIITKPFKMGDYVDIGQTSGVVQEIDLMCTRLKTFDNQVISVPNGILTTSVLKNASTEDTRRVDFKYSIGFDDDYEATKKALLKLAYENEDIFSEPEAFVGISGYGESSVNIDFRVWCYTQKYWEIKYYIDENVMKAFEEAGVSMPYTQIEISYKNK